MGRCRCRDGDRSEPVVPEDRPLPRVHMLDAAERDQCSLQDQNTPFEIDLILRDLVSPTSPSETGKYKYTCKPEQEYGQKEDDQYSYVDPVVYTQDCTIDNRDQKPGEIAECS